MTARGLSLRAFATPEGLGSPWGGPAPTRKY